jgi:16S rRNA (uracil1498-N3)-methyltransferase
MPVERYFTQYPLLLDEEIHLTDDEAHHLIHVMRTKIGEEVELVNGKQQLAKAKVFCIKKKEALLRVISCEHKTPGKTKMVLCQAIPRLNNLDFIVEKATEIGVHEIILFPAYKSGKKELSKNQWNRLQNLTISAMKQCGRWDLPSIRINPSLDQWKDEFQGPIYFGDLNSQTLFFPEVWEASNAVISFFIGPESGFHPEEIEILKKMGAIGVKLNENILRTETAALLAMGLMAHSISGNARFQES